MTTEGKSLPMTSEGKHLGYPKGSHKGRSDFRREVTTPQNKGIRREAPLKRSYQGSGYSLEDKRADGAEGLPAAGPGAGPDDDGVVS